MSVSLTEQAVRERRKTVTRRLGWKFLKPGDRLTLCRKVMGRKNGEPLVRLCDVEVVSVRREPISHITAEDIEREGVDPDILIDQSPEGWIEWFCREMRLLHWTSEITRIEWRYLDAPV